MERSQARRWACWRSQGWAALGATIGALAATLDDGGFPDERLKQLGEKLTPDSSALVAVIDHR